MSEFDDRPLLSEPYLASLETRLRERTRHLPRARRRRRALTAGGAAAAAAIVLALVLPAGPRLGNEARATTIVLPNGVTTRLDPSSASLLADVGSTLRHSGLTLKLRYVPVQGAAVGRVIGVEYPTGVRLDGSRAIVPRGLVGDVIATVGREPHATESPGTYGLSMFEANPHLCGLVDPTDAAVSIARLRNAGYTVRMNLVEFPVDSRGHQLPGPALQTPLHDPPPGTVVVTVGDAQSGVSHVDPDARDELTLEIADPTTLPDSEPIGVDASCTAQHG